VDARLLGDRYRLGALLGRGSAGRVHEAVDVVLGRPVAVKLYQASDDAIGRYRFAAEARLLAGLTHPGLVTVYDVCVDADEPFLVMRLVNGPTLRKLLDRGPFEPPAVARIGAQLADALAYVHAHDVVHRDIKPSNVLVDASGACHLTDFGLARALGAAHLTVSGEFVGTAAYVAPEQITDVDTGPPADIYALGLVLLECLTGHPEYTGTTVETALARLARPPRIPDTLPSGWRTLLSAMTVQDPQSRPDSAHCAESLNAIAEGCPEAIVPQPRISQPRPPSDNTPDRPHPVTSELGRPRRPHPRAAHGLTALALAAACAAVAASPTTVIPGQPGGLPHEQRTQNTADTETVAETAPPTLPTNARPSTAENPHSSPSTADSSDTTPPTTQTAPAPTTSTNPNKENGKQNNGGPSKTNGKKNGQN
jgi:eukaryotic-like serine/threonine-protein kinase